ncbi:GntR family transcriptional regulator [Lactococcus insecticola]|uniref:GntR family transcriptional regulator n=1 Tax=Pseudolactococcus insecticola TaxID=2709158 RepID=A0A6A0B5T3_9LACT|nr:GntR family transcriptional regulator [Lactococcus insecticola]GFH40789.1 GntR family transcriptional regulator [Lactococcus insecticola]
MKKFQIIYNDFRNKIVNGTYAAGQALPKEADVCETFGVSKMTAKRAFDMLVSDGFIVKQRGKGTFVQDISPAEMEILAEANQFLGTTALNPKKSVTSSVLHFETISVPLDVADKLNISPIEQVYDILRVRQVDGMPMVIEHTYMPIKTIPDLSLKNVESSIYNYIEHKLNLKIASARRTISARKATGEEAALLMLRKNDPVVEVKQIGYLADGVAFENSTSIHRYDEYEFEIVLHRKN